MKPESNDQSPLALPRTPCSASYCDGTPVRVGDRVQLTLADCTVLRFIPGMVVVSIVGIPVEMGVDNARFAQISRPEMLECDWADHPADESQSKEKYSCPICQEEDCNPKYY